MKTYPSPGPAHVTGIGSDASGNILVDGTFCNSPLDLGCGPLTAKGTGAPTQCGDIFLAKLDPAGNCLWSKSFGDTGQQYGGALVVDDLGGPAITGAYNGSVDFGSGVTLKTTAAFPYTSAYIAKYSATGAYEWAYVGNAKFGAMGTTANAIGTGIATQGNAVVSTGTFMYGNFDLGGHPLTATGRDATYLASFAR